MQKGGLWIKSEVSAGNLAQNSMDKLWRHCYWKGTPPTNGRTTWNLFINRDLNNTSNDLRLTSITFTIWTLYGHTESEPCVTVFSVSLQCQSSVSIFSVNLHHPPTHRLRLPLPSLSLHMGGLPMKDVVHPSCNRIPKKKKSPQSATFYTQAQASPPVRRVDLCV